MTTQKTNEKIVPAHLVGDALDGAREKLADVSNALTTGGKAYVSGLVEIGRALGGIGRQNLAQLGKHAAATLNAPSLRDVAELQAALVQSRIETATAEVKELADLTREKAEQVIAPLNSLLIRSRKA